MHAESLTVMGRVREMMTVLAGSLTVALALSALPARAATQEVIGLIIAPTFGSPALARSAYAAGQNGITGYVLTLAAGTTVFSLTAHVKPTGMEDFDVFFYSRLDDPVVAPLTPTYAGAGDEIGRPIPAGAAFAVVTLSTGANGSFRYTAR